jgi:hypothetical protein
LVLFTDVQHAMVTEKALKFAGYPVRLVAPPPELRKGCDLAVEINLVEKPGIERLLNDRGLAYIGIDPIKIATAPLLIDRRISEVPRPKDIGFTLCALNLDRAFDECLTLRLGEDEA